MGKLSGLQQRFEASRAGKIVIGVFVAVFVLVGVVWNIPDSPIRRSVMPAVEPIAAPVGLDQYWGMYGDPSRRAETVEVQVKMADGKVRVWTMEPGARGVGWWDRWIMLRRAVMTDANVRPQVARWAVREVSQPNDQPVAVAVVLTLRNLSAPGQEVQGSGKPVTKVLYQEMLAAPK
jgi:hypothetical protein